MQLPHHEFDVRVLLAQLRRQYSAEEVRHGLSKLLVMLRHRLAGSGTDVRLVAATYHRIAQHKADKHELEAANQALRRLLADLGVAVVGILPGGFITLPALYALARHYRVEVVAGAVATHEPEQTNADSPIEPD